jgi:hypothetical protein
MRWSFVALFAGLLALGSGTAHAALNVHGAMVDDESKKVGSDRYKSKEDWEKTLRFYRSNYWGKPGFVWLNVDTTPKVVKAVHIENTHKKRTWEGINIYETNGEIFIYVIKAEKAGKGK